MAAYLRIIKQVASSASITLPSILKTKAMKKLSFMATGMPQLLPNLRALISQILYSVCSMETQAIASTQELPIKNAEAQTLSQIR